MAISVLFKGREESCNLVKKVDYAIIDVARHSGTLAADTASERDRQLFVACLVDDASFHSQISKELPEDRKEKTL